MTKPSLFQRAWVKITWPSDEAALFNDPIINTSELKEGYLGWKNIERRRLAEQEKHGRTSDGIKPQFQSRDHIEKSFASPELKQRYRDFWIDEKRKEAEAARQREATQQQALRAERERQEAREHEMAQLRRRDPVAAYKQDRSVESFNACVSKNGYTLDNFFYDQHVVHFINNTREQIPLAAIPAKSSRAIKAINWGEGFNYEYTEMEGVLVLTPDYIIFSSANRYPTMNGTYEPEFNAAPKGRFQKVSSLSELPFRSDNKVAYEKFFCQAGLYTPRPPSPPPPAL